MDMNPKSTCSATQRARLAITWLLFVVFVALLGFGIVIYWPTTTNTTHLAGLAMAVIGILGIAALATSLKLARARALGSRGGLYAGWSYGEHRNHHAQWFHQQQTWEQRWRDDEYQPHVQQQNFYV